MIKGFFEKKPQAHMEIERKFLLKPMPSVEPLRRHKIRQGYLAREAGNVVRIRQKDEHYILSVKTSAKGISRHEIEVEISGAEGEILFAACPNPTIEKIREIYPFEGHIWEVDIFDGANRGLIVAEVELKSEQEKIILPDWIGPEVTGFNKFYNANLSLNPFRNWGVKYVDLVARMGDE